MHFDEAILRDPQKWPQWQRTFTSAWRGCFTMRGAMVQESGSWCQWQVTFQKWEPSKLKPHHCKWKRIHTWFQVSSRVNGYEQVVDYWWGVAERRYGDVIQQYKKLHPISRPYHRWAGDAVLTTRRQNWKDGRCSDSKAFRFWCSHQRFVK